ncbi:hypothetical protein A6R68_08003 [Neotoma lepida]|uniref:Uncharacterized protein n=1 Tax=Neotoma lepida TaxID=56216 RepID=A0A1A6GC60_NEOLE|nr:hypothetical protein A6R68_08003 [Neotoma lepida]
MTTSSSETIGPSVSTTVSSKSSGPSVTMTTESLGISNENHGLPATVVTSSVESSSVAVLLIAIILIGLLVLWRRRQNRRTGALTLSRGGKRNGVVDAWAGPSRVPDEEATAATASGPGGNKDSEALETEGSGQRPMLTTFFSRRKSRQGSLVLEELKSGPGPKKGEEEPLVGSDDEAVETPTSDGLEAKDPAAPQSI